MEEEAKELPVGSGREKPNRNPELWMPGSGRSLEGVLDEIEAIWVAKQRKILMYKRCIGFWIVVLIVVAIPVTLYSAL